jgi:hypothetical protein
MFAIFLRSGVITTLLLTLGLGTFSASAQMRRPPGSYEYTCDSCRFDGRYLSCRCRTSDGRWYRRPALDWGACGGSVENIEFVLTCRR